MLRTTGCLDYVFNVKLTKLHTACKMGTVLCLSVEPLYEKLPTNIVEFWWRIASNVENECHDPVIALLQATGKGDEILMLELWSSNAVIRQTS